MGVAIDGSWLVLGNPLDGEGVALPLSSKEAFPPKWSARWRLGSAAAARP